MHGRKSWWVILLSAGLALGAVGCRSAADSGEGAPSAKKTAPAEKPAAPKVALAPRPFKGPENAKVTMFEISDFQ